MSETVLVPGGRDVRGTLDGDSGGASSDALVVACPPHPRMGGTRSDSRLRAVSDALAEYGVACLRFDYGAWDEGRGERADARNALTWGRDRYEQVCLFGYSFGATIALLAAAGADPGPAAVSVLAPAARLDDDPDLDGVAAVDRIDCPLQIVAGERDGTVEWEPVVERAHEHGADVETVPMDHHFVGQHERVADAVASFLADQLTGA